MTNQTLNHTILQILETELVSLLINKDEKGFEYLYTNYSAALYGVISRMVVDQDIADELLQDAFLKIYHKIDSFDADKGKLFTWMLNLTRNLAIDKLRSKEMSQRRKSDNVGDSVYKLDRKSTPSQEDGIGVRELLDQLDASQKQVMELVYFGGFTQAEAAEELKLPLGTVKTRVRSALINLRKTLDIR
ncbi:MAG: sigma-70 family RNA polymerase sigma factor [Reichenbachiella sp.]|uniref:RNA polymerase sigma factor n=1 Tax=Reichenbachiella sp. TaxID=2184521 RepID=UPI003264C6E3